jgi:GTP-binding protein
MSAARPKIAEYPFTTITPNLGVVEAGDYTFVAADIPGLIEGAHAGVGLGHDFLRHIERTMVLLHVVDGSAGDPLGAFERVLDELRLYDPALAEKPQIVVVNKMDLPAARESWPELQRRLEAMGYEAMAVSAATREGIEALIYLAANLLREQARERARHDGETAVEVIRVRPPADRFRIERKRRTFHVSGETVERLAVMTDTESPEAMHRLEQRLRRMGVFSALERAGIRDGATVRIGDVELVWDESYEPTVKHRGAKEGRKAR